MKKQYALVFDLRRCIGCRTCVIACRVENKLDGEYSWMSLPTGSGTLADLPQGKFPNLSLYWQPATCMHCQKPSCLEACPDNAIYKRPDGIVLIDREKCTGCQLCLPACPYGVIQFNNQEKVAEKCTLCSHRIEQGLLPFCAKECIWGAIHFGDINDTQSGVSRLVSSRKGYVLKPEEGAQPSNRYLAP